jgi:hypothetical protein
MEQLLKGLGALLAIIALVIIVGFIIALPTLIIVNYLFTSAVLITMFGIPALTFWKAFWLNVLCGILFKSTSSSSK